MGVVNKSYRKAIVEHLCDMCRENKDEVVRVRTFQLYSVLYHDPRFNPEKKWSTLGVPRDAYDTVAVLLWDLIALRIITPEYREKVDLEHFFISDVEKLFKYKNDLHDPYYF